MKKSIKINILLE